MSDSYFDSASNRAAYDRWATSGPEDTGREKWDDENINSYPEDFYSANEDWISDSDLSIKWHDKLFDKGIDPEHAAKVIQRAFVLYRLK